MNLPSNPSAARNGAAELLRSLDWFTVGLYLLLVIAGAVSIYAASYDFDHASIFSFTEFSGKQIRWIGLALVLGLALCLVDSRLYETYAYPIYVCVLAVLFVTIFVAPNIKGSHSWLVLGPVSLQPAEFGKFATALALAKLFSAYGFKLTGSNKNFMRALLLIFLPVGLILAQNETGSALCYMALFFVLYREGMSGLWLMTALCALVIFVVALKYTDVMAIGLPAGQFTVCVLIMLTMTAMAAFYGRHIVAARNLLCWFAATVLLAFGLTWCGIQLPGLWYFGGVIGAAAVYLALLSLRDKTRHLLVTACMAVGSVLFMTSVGYAFNNVLQPHQQKRIQVTLGMEDDLRGAGYNVNQSKIAIGSGGVTGKGFLNGTQTKLKYVPEQHTDFIFCTIGEEEGFAGSATVLILFLALILRVITLAERQPRAFGRVYGYCVASFLIFHLAINIGMVIGLCPVIGIPLPFFSYGGSSLWGFTILLFILLRLDAGRRSYATY